MRKKFIKSSKARIILSGDVLELYEYEKPIFYDFSDPKGGAAKTSDENAEDSRKRAVQRAKSMIKKLVNANFSQHHNKIGKPYWSKFLTLTFDENIRDLTVANSMFTLFMKRLNYKLFSSKDAIIKYLAIVEFQKNGRVHFHVVLFNLPFIPRIIDVFRETWGNGLIRINAIYDETNIGSYISKYMTKSDLKKLDGRKSYFTSRNLKRPGIIRDEKTVLRIKLELLRAVFKREFDSEHTGKSKYSFFNLRNYPELKNELVANIQKYI